MRVVWKSQLQIHASSCWKAESVEGVQSQLVTCAWRKAVLLEISGINDCK